MLYCIGSVRKNTHYFSSISHRGLMALLLGRVDNNKHNFISLMSISRTRRGLLERQRGLAQLAAEPAPMDGAAENALTEAAVAAYAARRRPAARGAPAASIRACGAASTPNGVSDAGAPARGRAGARGAPAWQRMRGATW